MKLRVMKMDPKSGHDTVVVERDSTEAQSLPFESERDVVIAGGRSIRSYQELLEATVPYEGRVEEVDVYIMPRMMGG